MLSFVKVISSELDTLQRRVVKILRFGKSDVQTALIISPHGIDSNAVKDMVAIYAATGENGKTVLLGYLNKGQLAEIGETRLYSTDSAGALKTYVWLKNDGNILLGGEAKNLTRFQELESGFNQLKSDFNDLVQKWNTFANVYAPGSPSTTGSPATAETASSSSASIADAKIDNIKTN